ncbi:MAG: hypothetical protein AAFQ13_04645 [Pseudomonadota bacterium]
MSTDLFALLGGMNAIAEIDKGNDDCPERLNEGAFFVVGVIGAVEMALIICQIERERPAGWMVGVVCHGRGVLSCARRHGGRRGNWFDRNEKKHPRAAVFGRKAHSRTDTGDYSGAVA